MIIRKAVARSVDGGGGLSSSPAEGTSGLARGPALDGVGARRSSESGRRPQLSGGGLAGAAARAARRPPLDLGSAGHGDLCGAGSRFEDGDASHGDGGHLRFDCDPI